MNLVKKNHLNILATSCSLSAMRETNWFSRAILKEIGNGGVVLT